MIRARLASGDIATYIGPDPNGGHVIRADDGELYIVDTFTPELGRLATPQWLTSIFQGPNDGIATWPDFDKAKDYVAGQLRAYNRITALGQLIAHNGLYVIADSTGQPLRSEQ
jgi:hypothetical protein